MSWTTRASSPRGLTATVGSLPAATSDSRAVGAGRAGGVGAEVAVGRGVTVDGADGAGVGVAGGAVNGATVGAPDPGVPGATAGAGDPVTPHADAVSRRTAANVAARLVRTIPSHDSIAETDLTFVVLKAALTDARYRNTVLADTLVRIRGKLPETLGFPGAAPVA